MTTLKPKKTNEITPASVDRDLTWQDIVNSIVEQVTSSDITEIPDNVIRATELLLSGLSFYEVGKELGLTTATIKGWVKKYPPMALALQNGRTLLAKWRLARLEQQYLLAIDKSREILEMSLTETEGSPSTVNTKLTAVVAQQARFIIDQFTKVNNEISLKSDGENVTLSASGEALDYLAQQIAKNRQAEEPVEATYRIIDNGLAGEVLAPVLDEKGNPFFGDMGSLEIDEEGKIMCHICGKHYKKLSAHLKQKHDMDPDIYELTFILDEGAILDAES